MNTNQKLILVVGATGTQGKPVVNLLLKKGFRVRIMARNPDSAAAQELIKAGAEFTKGDLSDHASIDTAVTGVDAVYSVLPVDKSTKTTDNLEFNGGLALINAAKKAGVQQFVHASVATAGTHESFPRWGTGYWIENYWVTKWAIEVEVQKAGFPYWTILKPTVFMENLLPPLRNTTHPKFKEGKFITAVLPNKKRHFVAVEDTAKFACAAFTNPEEFNGKSIEIASDFASDEEVAASLSKVLGRPFETISLTPEQAIESGLHPHVVRVHEWCNEVGHHTDMEKMKTYNIPLTSFEEWITLHREELEK